MRFDRRTGLGIAGWLVMGLLATGHRACPAAETLRVGSAAIEIPVF